MIVANVRDLSKELRKAFEPLTGRQVAQAASSAINSTLKKDRVFIGRQIRSVYRMNVFDAKNEIPQVMSTISTLTGKLKGNAGFTPMEYFKITSENINSGEAGGIKRAAKYAMKNGKRVVVGRQTTVQGSGRMSTFEITIMGSRTSLFTHTFVANTKNGPMLMNRGTYTSRTNLLTSSSARVPLARLRTLSVFQEINSKKIVGKNEALLKLEYSREYIRLLELRLTGKGGWK